MGKNRAFVFKNKNSKKYVMGTNFKGSKPRQILTDDIDSARIFYSRRDDLWAIMHEFEKRGMSKTQYQIVEVGIMVRDYIPYEPSELITKSFSMETGKIETSRRKVGCVIC